MARRSGPTGRLEERRTLAGFPSGPRHLDFLRPPQLEHRAPRISGFWTVGFVWNSLDSLVRNEPSQWVTRDPRPIFNSCGPFASIRSARPRRHSIRRSTTLEPRQAKTAGRAGIMAIDIGRAGLGIGTNLTPSSLFGKKLSTGRPYVKNPRPQSLSTRSPTRSPLLVDARLWTSAELRARLAPQPRGPRKARRYGGSNAKTMISPRTRAANRMPGQPATRRRQASEARRRRNRTASQAPATPG